MKIDYKIVAGIFAAGWAYEAYANLHNVRLLRTKVKQLRGVANYQVNKLNEYKVPCTEFDEIAIEELFSW